MLGKCPTSELYPQLLLVISKFSDSGLISTSRLWITVLNSSTLRSFSVLTLGETDTDVFEFWFVDKRMTTLIALSVSSVQRLALIDIPR